MDSNQSLYVIAGATGNTGKPIAHALLDAGKRVRIITRDEDKAAELIAKGAEAVIGSSVDKAILEKAFQGADMAYVLIPPNPNAADFRAYQLESAQNIAHALKVNKVPRAVTLSSVGAHLESGAGVVQGLHHMEKTINGVPGLHVLHLRPAYFMENTLGSVYGIKEHDVLGTPLRPDLVLPVIATADISAHAVQRMLNPDWTGQQVQHLLGARDVTYPEMAQVYGTVIGKPELPYAQIPVEDFRNFIIHGWGATEDFADQMVEFTHALNAGAIAPNEERSPANTTPTAIEDFAPTFAYVYNQ